jgi:Putative restriction endonuclease
MKGGGPDFLVEVESPGDDTEEKVPFYSKIGARELLILHRDKRTLRHDRQELILVKPSTFEGKEWLLSSGLPLAFRRTLTRGVPAHAPAAPTVSRASGRFSTGTRKPTVNDRAVFCAPVRAAQGWVR